MRWGVTLSGSYSVPSHRGSRVWADVAALPPGQVEAPDELQVERMADVQHGEAHDVWLIVHHIVKSQEWEILKTETERASEQKKTRAAAVTCRNHAGVVNLKCRGRKRTTKHKETNGFNSLIGVFFAGCTTSSWVFKFRTGTQRKTLFFPLCLKKDGHQTLGISKNFK